MRKIDEMVAEYTAAGNTVPDRAEIEKAKKRATETDREKSKQVRKPGVKSLLPERFFLKVPWYPYEGETKRNMRPNTGHVGGRKREASKRATLMLAGEDDPPGWA
jgi:hypothetical protein